MLPINTMQPVVRDTIPPTFSNDAMVSAEVKYGTNIFISGLKALDEGRDISRDIKYSFDALPNTFVEGGSIPTLFYVYDKGGNYIEQEVEVPITGSPKHKTPSLYDFTQLTEIPAAFTQTNGEWATTENGLMSVGEMPPSPRWNISLDTDADADFQIQFVPVTAGLVHGVTFRGSNLDDMFYCFYRDGVFTLWERFEGVPQEVTFVTDETLNESSVISLGVSCLGDTLTIYNGSEPIITHRSEQLRFSRQFGIISTSDQSYYQKIMVGEAGTLTFGEYEMANEPPIANAGPDQSVAAGVRVQLNASMSTDPEDGSISQFGWEQVDNGADAVVLEFANTATPEFTAPSSLTAQVLEFRVQAQDSEGATSTDTVIINVAALEENAILSTMETLDFELVTQGNLVAYKGRANREVMQLKPSSTSGIVTAGGYLDVSNNGIVKVEIIADGKKISNENSDSIKIDGTRILARLGDLDIPTGGRDSATPTFMIVLYVGSDTRGLVVASNATSGYKPLSYRVEDAA